MCSAVVAFLYPGYASFKCLSQRPASEPELERWLTYWSVLGCIVFVEYVAEWLVSWYAVRPLVDNLKDILIRRPYSGFRSIIRSRHSSYSTLFFLKRRVAQ